MKLSIVATLYKSESYIKEFYRRATASAKELVNNDYEIILVNDGSPDNSLKIALQLMENDNHLVIIDLSRNFGHHKAMMTGLSYAKGLQIFLIDTDLEEEPEWLLSFAKQMDIENCDVVYGVQNLRKGGWFERLSGNFFYYFFNVITALPLPKNLITARLMTHDYVQALLLHTERELFIPGLFLITGFTQHSQIIKKHNTSDTTYTFQKKVSLFVNSLTSFTSKPLIAIFYFGTAISILAVFYTSYLLIHWLFFTKPLSGWTSIIASIWILGGITISSLGIIGIYISKIFSEIKQRPL